MADARGDLQRVVSGRLDLDPTTAERGFVVLAPVFSSPLLLPGIVRIPTKEAPKIDLKVRPVRRRGASLGLVDAVALAEGDADLVVAALLADLPGLCSEALYAERFVCLMREDHPEVGESLDLETSGLSSTASWSRRARSATSRRIASAEGLSRKAPALAPCPSGWDATPPPKSPPTT